MKKNKSQIIFINILHQFLEVFEVTELAYYTIFSKDTCTKKFHFQKLEKLSIITLFKEKVKMTWKDSNTGNKTMN